MSAERESWVQRMLEGIPRPLPEFGSPEWLALPDGDRLKIGSIVVAAECWARDGDDLEQRLRTEVLAASRAHKAAEDAEYVAQRDAWADSWTGSGFRSDPARKAEIEAEWVEWVGAA